VAFVSRTISKVSLVFLLRHPHNEVRQMKAKDIPVPIDERYFEDYVPSAMFEYGSVTLTEDEILDFARRFDPQYIHTDARAALPAAGTRRAL
jgi:acyl dehydratase